MSAKTGIEWTDSTWNPIIGCSRVSEGCRHCYAEGIAARFGQGKPTVYSGLTVIANGHAQWTGKIVETKQLLAPLSWRKPRRVFVNSMSDLFHANVTDEQRDHIFAVMALAERHTFQILTKRPALMFEYMTGIEEERGSYWRAALWEGYAQKLYSELRLGTGVADVEEWLAVHLPLPNVWLGVSVENQAAADERIPLLLNTPAAVRFVSAEPLLGSVDVSLYLRQVRMEGEAEDQKLDWVICGGESGPGARPMDPVWARSIRDQCASANVAFFMKQMGSVYGARKGHELPPDLEIKQFPGERA